MALKWMGEQVTRKLETKLSRGLSRGLNNVARKISAALPRVTGKLADSVDVKVDKLEGSIGTDVPYASFVEFGTIHQEPNGTWRRVLHEEKNNLKRDIIR